MGVEKSHLLLRLRGLLEVGSMIVNQFPRVFLSNLCHRLPVVFFTGKGLMFLDEFFDFTFGNEKREKYKGGERT